MRPRRLDRVWSKNSSEVGEVGLCRCAGADVGVVSACAQGGLALARRCEAGIRQRERAGRGQHRRQQLPHHCLDQLSVPRQVPPVHRHARAIRQDRCANYLKDDDMEIKPIKSKADYRAALKETETLMTAERDTPGASAWTYWSGSSKRMRTSTMRSICPTPWKRSSSAWSRGE